MHYALAHLSQVFVLLVLRIVCSLLGRGASVEYLSLQVEEFLSVKLDLKGFLSDIVVLINHHILQHRIFVLNLIIDLLIQVSHGIIWVFASEFCLIIQLIIFVKDIR